MIVRISQLGNYPQVWTFRTTEGLKIKFNFSRFDNGIYWTGSLIEIGDGLDVSESTKLVSFKGWDVPRDVISVTNSAWLKTNARPYIDVYVVPDHPTFKIYLNSWIATKERRKRINVFVSTYTSTCGNIDYYYRQILVYFCHIRHPRDNHVLAWVWFIFPTTLSLLGQLIIYGKCSKNTYKHKHVLSGHLLYNVPTGFQDDYSCNIL